MHRANDKVLKKTKDLSFSGDKRGNINNITDKYIAVFKDPHLPYGKESECDTQINRAKISLYVTSLIKATFD